MGDLCLVLRGGEPFLWVTWDRSGVCDFLFVRPDAHLTCLTVCDTDVSLLHFCGSAWILATKQPIMRFNRYKEHKSVNQIKSAGMC